MGLTPTQANTLRDLINRRCGALSAVLTLPDNPDDEAEEAADRALTQASTQLAQFIDKLETT